MKDVKRRDFLKKGSMIAGGTGLFAGVGPGIAVASQQEKEDTLKSDLKYTRLHDVDREFNAPYQGKYLNRVAFPIGGFGTGMFCLEGTGCLSHFSVRHTPSLFNEPFMMGAISIKGMENGAKVLEGKVPSWKIFGKGGAGTGSGNTTYGFPRFKQSAFEAKFPFGKVNLQEDDFPLEVEITGWNPFTPTDEDNSSLPVGSLEYTFINTSDKAIEAVFSYHTFNFMRVSEGWRNWVDGNSVKPMKNGFILSQECQPGHPEYEGSFAIFTNNDDTVVDHKLFKGGWYDSRTILWNDIESCNMPNDAAEEGADGASLYVPISLKPGETKTIPLMFSWYVPHSSIRTGIRENDEFNQAKEACATSESGCCDDYADMFYEPWYSTKYSGIDDIANYWRSNYKSLRDRSEKFSNSFYGQTLPAEVIEAIAANLTILKSTTVLRQRDGKFWAYEGSGDDFGCCVGTCTHVWNYAQAVPHLFPRLERSLRDTEFFISQNKEGHQTFRDTLPLQEPKHDFYAAADGQLGGPMKVYREWRVSGDTAWMKKIWPKVKDSIEFCIREWDPKEKGILEEPHHNTYDIEFWGPDGMCTSFYLGALKAVIEMGIALKEDVDRYQVLFEKGKKFLESELYDGEYFIQKIQWEGLESKSPQQLAEESLRTDYSDEALRLLHKEGPKYQYGLGCLSDGILGCWIASMCGLENFIDNEKVKSHLNAIYKYNFKKDLSDHVNPQRPSYAVGEEGGVLLCSWPKGGKLTLPFVYSNEVWTGIEYQAASHLIEMGEVEKGLDIVREVRKRYDGQIRNPFNEYECGSWYARALSSYGLIQSLTGVRYDAVDQFLYIDSKIGDNFTSFFSGEHGFGQVGLKNGNPWIKMDTGELIVKKCYVNGKKMKVTFA